ncbi:MAG: pyruvoyl-dependent arginine decarboxylase [Chloroflexi bacterium]|nr:pyruvoyl-dependent arginine decarboxylase [Chloroflexota bacterium]
MHIQVSVGTGEGPTALAAFDAALSSAGMADYNLLFLSSVIPPHSVIEKSRFVPPPDDYGHRLYVVLARQQEERVGKSAWAGLGWAQDPSDGRGLFVELTGENRERVQEDIEATLASMVARRGCAYGPVKSELAGVACHGRPVCALVIAAYESQGWGA